jgi:hypothetical protein
MMQVSPDGEIARVTASVNSLCFGLFFFLGGGVIVGYMIVWEANLISEKRDVFSRTCDSKDLSDVVEM